ncbi:MAG: hypothetical protein COS92_04920 [Desulfobacterales bacterium CG07_land_8_20_14_0_80_52_14]|nr:MAG: hypothetical protein COX20_07700 [Desulfobacterales bacterium CG23_combo_of_CG06-09_8_20_14_all_52_9]PIU49761.1 MAG: hypothetical protein COS92_04920 [Desulfobacterales bacterium CG07_land_8_20_14_0_80_52_14]
MKRFVIFILAAAFLLALVYIYREYVLDQLTVLYRILADREEIKRVVIGFGPMGPAVFILIQILQVLLAPIPGEATGFIGGFLFGSLKGFIYSSIGLTLGSCLNFGVGRLLGKRYVRKAIPEKKLNWFDAFVRHQGAIVVFICFLIPGFPKDLLSLFLGVTSIPFKVFIAMAGIGRIPGTLMLSIQGAFLFEKQYGLLLGMLCVSALLVIVAYRYRERLYRWIERLNDGS